MRVAGLAAVAAAVSFLTVSSAAAEEWWLISFGGNADKPTVNFIDRSSLKVTGSRAWFWQTQYVRENGVVYKSVLQRWVIDCLENTFSSPSVYNFNADGSAGFSNSFPEKLFDNKYLFTAIPPTTLLSAYKTAVCDARSWADQSRYERVPEGYALEAAAATILTQAFPPQ